MLHPQDQAGFEDAADVHNLGPDDVWTSWSPEQAWTHTHIGTCHCACAIVTLSCCVRGAEA